VLEHVPLIPAHAGIQIGLHGYDGDCWVPAFAGTSGHGHALRSLSKRHADIGPAAPGDPAIVQLQPGIQSEIEFGWKVVKHIKSNAIVYVRPGQTAAVGAGQMSRVDSVNIAAMKAHLPLAGTAVASDAYFPFPDGLEQAVRHGATAFIQPGGSIKDPDVIAAADKLGVAMIFTGVRHFRH